MLFSPVFVASDPRPLFSAKPPRSPRLRVRSSLNPLECAVLDKHRVLPCFSRIRAHATPLECALPRVLFHKLFRMRSSEKSAGRGSSRRSLFPNSFPCHTSENSPGSLSGATDPKSLLRKFFACHTSETPRGEPCLRRESKSLCTLIGRSLRTGMGVSPHAFLSTFNRRSRPCRDCRLSTSRAALPSFSKQRVFHNAFALKRLRTLPKNRRMCPSSWSQIEAAGPGWNQFETKEGTSYPQMRT